MSQENDNKNSPEILFRFDSPSGIRVVYLKETMVVQDPDGRIFYRWLDGNYVECKNITNEEKERLFPKIDR